MTSATAVSATPTPPASGMSHYSETVSGGVLHSVIIRDVSGEVLGIAAAFQPSQVTHVQLNALNQTTGTIPAGILTGASLTYVISSNNTPGNQLCRSAAQLFADTPNAAIGVPWLIRIVNSGTGTFTLAADAGATVTLVGASMTIATNTWKDFVAVFNTASTATITEVGNGTYS